MAILLCINIAMSLQFGFYSTEAIQCRLQVSPHPGMLRKPVAVFAYRAASTIVLLQQFWAVWLRFAQKALNTLHWSRSHSGHHKSGTRHDQNVRKAQLETHSLSKTKTSVSSLASSDLLGETHSLSISVFAESRSPICVFTVKNTSKFPGKRTCQDSRIT